MPCTGEDIHSTIGCRYFGVVRNGTKCIGHTYSRVHYLLCVSWMLDTPVDAVEERYREDYMNEVIVNALDSDRKK